jgi:hypothetical protein
MLAERGGRGHGGRGRACRSLFLPVLSPPLPAARSVPARVGNLCTTGARVPPSFSSPPRRKLWVTYIACAVGALDDDVLKLHRKYFYKKKSVYIKHWFKVINFVIIFVRVCACV